MVTRVPTNMFKGFDLPAVAPGEVLTFDGTNWVAQPGLPAGTILQYAGSASPAGWLLCNGATISRADYAALFTAIGTAFGSGDGSTTFNLPDFRGRVPVGLDNMGGSSANRITASQADTLGGSGGAQSQVPAGSVSVSGTVGSTTLSLAQTPSHSHYVVDMGHPGAGSLGTNQVMTDSVGSNTLMRANTATPAPDSGQSNTQGSSSSHNHSFSGSGSLSGNTLDVTQPWLAVNYIIKA